MNWHIGVIARNADQRRSPIERALDVRSEWFVLIWTGVTAVPIGTNEVLPSKIIVRFGSGIDQTTKYPDCPLHWERLVAS